MKKQIKWWLAGLAFTLTTALQFCSPAAQKVAPAPNGIAYIPDYKNWQVVNVTHRHDNNTLRVIYGNAIAVNAVKTNNTNPWPDGTILAKASWIAQTDSTGFVQAGPFEQVQFMIKDSHRYASTKGWGWARWKGDALKPYGQNALFTKECISCHTPRKDQDFVFTDPAKTILKSLNAH